MPKEIKDLKEFIKIFRRENKSLPVAEKITIKKNKRNGITKFKLRTSRYLFTLKVDDKVKAEKIMQSIPPTLKKDTINWAARSDPWASDADLVSQSPTKSKAVRECISVDISMWTQLVCVSALSD